jgi:hypothetical protein
MTEFDQAYIGRGTLRVPAEEYTPQSDIFWHAVGACLGLVALGLAVGYVLIGAMK